MGVGCWRAERIEEEGHKEGIEPGRPVFISNIWFICRGKEASLAVVQPASDTGARLSEISRLMFCREFQAVPG